MNNKPELLLPAGDTEAFHAAIAAGADAVYLGAKHFNARERAFNFSPAQLRALVETAHENNTSVYITLNTLIKNSEISELLDSLHQIRQIKPDALIIQDWGLYHLLTKYFPEFKIHASTQMGNHNSSGTYFSKKQGFERVIMAREINFSELKTILNQDGSDIEIFVHGALCYSFSGMCLFSSYLGGMSANRGRCKQPCRRFYEGDNNGFLFSLKDNQLINYIPEFSKIGVKSLKIEGRLKPAEYVYRVGKAYRMALDNNNKITEAKKLLEYDLGRDKTQYFVGGNVSEAITNQPASGKYLGKINNSTKEYFEINSKAKLTKNARIRILSGNYNEKAVFKIKEFSASGNNYRIKHNKNDIVDGDLVFLTAIPDIKHKSKFDNLRPVKTQMPDKEKQKIISDLSLNLNNNEKKTNITIRIDNLAWLPKVDLRETDTLIMKFTVNDLEKLDPNSKVIQKYRNKLAIELPDFIFEDKISYYRNKLNFFYKAGIKKFVINHLSQKLLLKKRAEIIASEKVYSMNDVAIKELKANGIYSYIRPFENDFNNLLNGRDRKGIIPAYFFPALFVSRMPVKTGKYFTDDEKRNYFNINRNGLTYIIPENPVCLTQYAEKLRNNGFSDFLVDLSFMKPSSNKASTIIKRLKQSQQIQPSGNFNFKNELS